MQFRESAFLAAFLASLLLAGNRTALGAQRNGKVNCARGEKIADALAAGFTVITIVGVCAEEVTITRDNVTLRGRSSTDGIRSPSPNARLLSVANARGVQIQQMTLYGTDAFVGLVASFSQFVAWGLNISGAAVGVLVTEGASGTLHDSVVIDSTQSGVTVFSSADLRLFSTRVENTTGFAVKAWDGGHVSIGEGTLVRNTSDVGLFAATGGSLRVGDATVDGSDTGVQVNQGGSAELSIGANIVNSRRGGIAVHGAAVNMFGGRIADNGQLGVGLFNGSRLGLNGGIIEGNGGPGILLVGGASVRTSSPNSVIIRNNTGDGMAIQDTSVGELGDSSATQIINNGGWGIFCSPAPAVAQINGTPGSVSGNAAGQINCPGVLIP